jgi:membrane protein implicated in regulation of membrane protease activity
VASGIVFSAAYAVYVLVVSLPRVSIGQARWPLVAEAGLFLAGAGLLGAYLWRFVRRAKRVNSRQSTVEG